ncbi:MAG: DEAD/DEAH box helicase family protein [Candidatus Gracilibacteria bacterium]
MTLNTIPDVSHEGVPKKPGKITDKSSKITTTRNRSSMMIRTMDHLLQSLDTLSMDPNERELQRQTYTAIRESLRRGEKSGIIKLPTGTGKTWVFANLLNIFQRNGLILVPRTDLYSSTIRDLREVGFKDSEIRLIAEESGANSEERMLSILTDPSIDWSSGRNVTIMSYQSLNSMFKTNPEIGSFMRSHFDMIIEDEAHRALGKKTKNAVGTLTEDGEDQEEQNLEEFIQTEELDIAEQSELEAEINVDHILGLDGESFQNDDRFNYKFTATPDLLKHSVSDESEYIFYATFEQAVRTRAIVLPQYVNMGSAYLRSGDLEKWKVKDIEALSDQEDDQFIDENGLSIRDKIIDAYIEKKQQHNNSLPAVAFASTIKHAAILVDAMRAKGIKAQRVTSARGDISSEQATEMMDRGQLDVIITVTKVSEGFDYAPLSCALWFAPVLSPAKITQGNGRISRITPDKMPEHIEDEQGRIIPSPSAYIIAPSEWYSGSKRASDSENLEEIHEDTNGDDVDDNNEDQNPQDQKPKKLSRIGNFYELLVSQGEFNYNTLPTNFQNIISLKDSIFCEVGDEVQIDGVVYMGITGTQEVIELRGETILKNAKKDSTLTILQGRQQSGYPIQLVPKSFIEGLKQSWQYTCEVGDEVQIDGVVYMGVTNAQEVMGLRGGTILKNVKNDPTLTILQRKQSSGHPIQLVPKSFIEGLLNTCEAGEEKTIDGVVYMGVTNTQEVMELQGQTILANAKKDSALTILQGRQQSGYPIQLVPKSFIEGLKQSRQYTCETGEEKTIDGVVYMGVVTAQEVMGLQGFTILKNAKNDPTLTILQGRQKNGLSIQLVPKSFIEGLKQSWQYTCEAGEEKTIDGVVYMGVTRTQEVMGLQGQTILRNAKKDPTLTILQGRQKNGFPIQLIPKSFIEGLVAKKTK